MHIKSGKALSLVDRRKRWRVAKKEQIVERLKRHRRSGVI
jgi:hypothetical protein